MRKNTYDVAFVVDQMPSPNMSGAPTYNHSILDALGRLGLTIFVLVTSRRLPKFLFPVPDPVPSAKIDFKFVHASGVGRKHFAVDSVSASARMLKSRIERWKHPKRVNGKAARIERFPTTGEIKRAKHILDRVHPSLLIVDTIFRDAFVQDWPACEKRVLIAHDVFHERVSSFEANGYRVTPRIDADEERRRASRYPFILAISDRDAQSLRQLVPGSEVKTVFPVVQAASSVKPSFGSGRILYLGTAAYHNVDGLRWFLDDVWPSVIRARPDAILDVVGSIGSVISPQTNVVIHGRVDDFSEIAGNAAFAINPVRMGSGIKVKMVDYFNARLGCITTTAGALGFPAAGRPFVACDEASAFAATVLEWLGDAETCRRMSELSCEYAGNFSTDAVDRVIRDLVGC